MGQDQVNGLSTVVWGRGPAIVALAASLTKANVGTREIWHQDSLASLPEAARRELKNAACGVPVIADMNSTPRVLERLEAFPEVNTVAEVFYTKVIAPAVLERVKIINIHPAPLPRYRGAHPLPWQIIRGESESAVSFHVMVPEIDAGPIIKQVPFSIEESDDYGSVFNKVLDIIRNHAGTIFSEFMLGRLAPVPQNHTLATFVVKRAPMTVGYRGLLALATYGTLCARSPSLFPGHGPCGTGKK